jgi:integrase
MRQAKPFRYRGHWSSWIAGRLVRLGPVQPDDKKKAPDPIWAELFRLRQEAAERMNLSGQSTLEVAFQEYLAKTEKSDRTKRKIKHQLAKLLRQFGQSQVSTLRISAADWFQTAFQECRGSTWNGSVKSARAFFAWMVARKMVQDNPFKLVSLKTETKRERYCKPEEFQALMRHADKPWKAKLLFLKLTGCRPQDLYQARWDWLQGGTMVIPPSHHKTGHKTGKPRVLYLSQVVQRLLATLPKNSGEIFPAESIQTIDSGFSRIRRLAGIAADANGEELTPYCLRHMFCSFWANKPGVPLAIVAKMMGHTRIQQTMSYVHNADSEVLKHIG